MNFNEAIEIIEAKSVYRLQAPAKGGGGMFNSTNGMTTTYWTKKTVLNLAEIMKHKPKSLEG